MDVGRYGPWAVIIGGSEGIGASFARRLASDGFKLVLIARKEQPLEKLAGDLRSAGAEVRIASVDMSTTQALHKLRLVTDDIEVGLLIYNAGANSKRGDFVEIDPSAFRDVLNVNVMRLCEVVHHYGRSMRRRNRGAIITIGSISGYAGVGTLASYCGAKAFLRTFSEALWIECKSFNIDVLHLVIGLTATPAMARLGYDLSQANSPDTVAQEALENVGNGPTWIVGGASIMDLAQLQSRVADRAEIIRSVILPART